MKRVERLIERVEGEALLDFTMDREKISDVSIGFPLFRGIETILEQRPPEDALVITPRVCGICNHAHLLSAVRALEDGYTKAGVEISLSSKAKSIREFTLACELIQNHMKWFYMVLLPQLEQLVDEKSGENHTLKAGYIASTINKASALFGGQWPHSSYAVVGGVTCDPTYMEVLQAQTYIEEVIRFFEHILLGVSFERYFLVTEGSEVDVIEGDFGRLLTLLKIYGLASEGESYDRFLVLGESGLSCAGKSMATRVSSVQLGGVEEYQQEGSYAKGVCYKMRHYEVGSLARAMVSKVPLVKSIHKRYKDALYTRIFARVDEAVRLLVYAKELLASLRLDEPSVTLTTKQKPEAFEGVGVVEAARGSLIHQVEVKEGKIAHYNIIVPTQWNLSQGTDKERGVAIEAMVGERSVEEASFIFRSFDVCSVCTTQ